MIAPDSASYPILGAAQACGVDYGVALNLYWRTRLMLREEASLDDVMEVWRAGVAAHGLTAMERLQSLLRFALIEGRLYSPDIR